MEWKITDIHAKDGMIVSAKYHVKHIDGDTVETEGYWHFPECGHVPFDQVTEELVIEWIKEASKVDGKSTIEANIENQFNQPKKVIPPWMPQVFKVNV